MVSGARLRSGMSEHSLRSARPNTKAPRTHKSTSSRQARAARVAQGLPLKPCGSSTAFSLPTDAATPVQETENGKAAGLQFEPCATCLGGPSHRHPPHRMLMLECAAEVLDADPGWTMFVDVGVRRRSPIVPHPV